MKRFFFGLLVGVMIALAAQKAYQYWQYTRVQDDVEVFRIARRLVESRLAGSRVLDVSVSPRSYAQVNYVYDKLYDAHITYERHGKIKKITAPIGKYRKQWIIPNNADLTIWDDTAQVLHTRSTSQTR